MHGDGELHNLQQAKKQAYEKIQEKIKRYDKIEELAEHLKECMTFINGKDPEKKEKSEQFLKRICEKFRQIEEKEKMFNGRTK